MGSRGIPVAVATMAPHPALGQAGKRKFLAAEKRPPETPGGLGKIVIQFEFTNFFVAVAG
jgi:hypothetical protein